MSTRFDPAGPLRGSLRPPPDKSISHRAALLAAMGEGRSLLANYLDAADTRSTLAAVEALGARVDFRDQGTGLEGSIEGAGLQGAAEAALDVGNAGTLIRLLPGWLAGQRSGRTWVLDGDESIRRRPVDRIAEPLRMMGAEVECRHGRLPPLRVSGGRLHGVRYRLPIASAQVKSCVLLAGVLADSATTVLEPSRSRDHTERMLRSVGVDLDLTAAGVTVRPVSALEPLRLIVPGDFSSAAFPLVAALLVPGSEVVVDGVGLNPTRTGLLGILARMGAAVEVRETTGGGPEPVGSLLARHSRLCGTEVGGEEVPLAIDELPLVALAGCFAEGETVIRDAGELRLKESDRIATVVDGLRALGASAEATDDGMVIRGNGGLEGGALDAGGDHRLAMAGAVAGLASTEGVSVEGFEAVAVSYPRFEADLAQLLGRG